MGPGTTSGLQKSDETIAARRGFALSLGALGPTNLRMRREEVLQALRREALGEQLPGGDLAGSKRMFPKIGVPQNGW